MQNGWNGRFVDKDRGGSFRQPYPSMAVMNRQSFLPPLKGYGEDAIVMPETTEIDPRRCDPFPVSGYPGAFATFAICAILTVGGSIVAFQKGRKHGRA